MLDFGFSEILLTSAIALVVLGPERLPKVARQVGNWMGRARAMARQLSEQLEREVSAEEFLREQTKAKAPTPNRIAPQNPPPENPAIDRYAPMPAHDPIPPRSPLPDTGAAEQNFVAARTSADAASGDATPSPLNREAAPDAVHSSLATPHASDLGPSPNLAQSPHE